MAIPQALTAARDRVRQAQRTLDDATANLVRLQQNPPASPEPGVDPIAQARTTRCSMPVRTGTPRPPPGRNQSTSGAMVPMSEVVFLPDFPARVDKLTAVVGADVAAPLITLSSGALVGAGQAEYLGSARCSNRSCRSRSRPSSWASRRRARSAALGEIVADESGTRSHPVTVTAVDTPSSRPSSPARTSG